MAGCYISLTACPTWLGEQPLTGVFALGAPSEVGGGEGQTSSNPRFIGGPQSLFAGTNQFSPGKGSHLTHTHSLITLFRLCFLLRESSTIEIAATVTYRLRSLRSLLEQPATPLLEPITTPDSRPTLQAANHATARFGGLFHRHEHKHT